MPDLSSPKGPLGPLRDLVACPRCDQLHRAQGLAAGEIARCTRCGTVLITGRLDAIPRIVALSFAVLILMFAATFFPFLHLETGGLSNNASLFDAASAFSDGWLIPLSFAVAALIVVIPVTRVSALLYALLPLVGGHPPARHAAQAFRLAQRLKPWAMAEIFILGVAVALVKVAGLATVLPGPAFWAFCALVIITVLKDNMICNWTIWNELTTKPAA